MKANIPKAKKILENLSDSDIKRLSDMYTKKLQESIIEDRKISQELFLKFSLAILHEPPFNFDEDKAMTFLYNWRGIKRRSYSFLHDEEQDLWLKQKLSYISNWPDDFIKELVTEKSKKDN